MLTRLLPQLR